MSKRPKELDDLDRVVCADGIEWFPVVFGALCLFATLTSTVGAVTIVRWVLAALR